MMPVLALILLIAALPALLVPPAARGMPIDLLELEFHQCPSYHSAAAAASESYVEQIYALVFTQPATPEEPPELSKSGSSELCAFCGVALPIARHLVVHNQTKLFARIATLVCVELKITDEKVCSMSIALFQDAVFSVIRDTKLGDKDLCSTLLGCTPIKHSLLDWNVTLPDVPKPPVTPPIPPKAGSPILRVLQLSDLHVDFEYQPGALVDCDQPLCCRNSSTTTSKKPTRKAGHWGSFGQCDVPIWTVEAMLEHIAKTEKFDFVYWTGDLPPHDIWAQKRSNQVLALEKLTALFKKYFPDKKIFSAIGNHETQPVNLFPPPEIKEDNITWLYQAVSESWTQIGLPVELTANLTRGAFYTIPVRPGLRLVSLNMNYCPPENFWLFVNATDILGQLSWLADVLQQSENIDEKVHIIGHIQPGACLASWSENYYRIVNRYEATVVGQFFGHTHNDEIEVFWDLADPSRAVGVAYLAASATTFANLNPSYRIYTIDGAYAGSSWQVLDYETYFTNLTEANVSEQEPLRWQLEYSVKDAYQLDGLYPGDWAGLVRQMEAAPNGTLADAFIRHYFASSDLLYKGCGLACRKEVICRLKQARSDKLVPCRL